jgi:hypothetical protein
MPPRGGVRSNAQLAVDEVLKAARFLPGLLNSGHGLTDFEQQWKAVAVLASSMGVKYTNETVMRKLLLFSTLPKQLCSCLALALRHFAAATARTAAPTSASSAAATLRTLASDDPVLAVMGELAHLVLLLVHADDSNEECRQGFDVTESMVTMPQKPRKTLRCLRRQRASQVVAMPMWIRLHRILHMYCVMSVQTCGIVRLVRACSAPKRTAATCQMYDTVIVESLSSN